MTTELSAAIADLAAARAANWQASPLKYEGYRTLAVYDTSDPETIIVEQEAVGAGASTGEFALPNIVVLTVRDGHIAHLRDYVNVLAATAAIEGADSGDRCVGTVDGAHRDGPAQGGGRVDL